MRVQEAQKHTDLDPDPDPEHCNLLKLFTYFSETLFR
jgi:hypothetical protein